MADLAQLLAARAHLDQQIATKYQQVLAELVAAKTAHLSLPTPDTMYRKDAAVNAVRALRAALRQGRAGHAVGGDAFVSTTSIEG